MSEVEEPARVGLRERKKTATRALILEVASRLFLRDGFDAVTLERVATECEVSVRTILRYFETKEALALAPERDALEDFRSRLPDRAGNAVAFWRSMVASGRPATADNSAFRAHLRMVFGHPALFAQLLAITYEYEDLLADAIGDEIGGADPLGARLLATMLVAGNSATVRQWLLDDEPIDFRVLVHAVDYAAGAFRPSTSPAIWARYAPQNEAPRNEAPNNDGNGSRAAASG